MAEFLKLREADDPRDLIHRAVHCLVEGGLVVFPSEIGELVAASSLESAAVLKLSTLANTRGNPQETQDGGSLLLGFKAADEAQDYVMETSPTCKRLMLRCWPGSVVLAIPMSVDHGLLGELPLETQQAVLRKSNQTLWEVWCRIPNHAVVLAAMALLPAPLVFWEDRGSSVGKLPSSNWVDDVDLILEDAPRENQQTPSVVRVQNNSWTLLEPGIVTESHLNQMTGKVILFVCTGNTCRSPLAEGLFRKLMADRLACSPDELPERGYTILSAGLAATSGSPAARESVDVAVKYGANLTSHSSQPLTDELLEKADHVYTMTHSHRDSILFARPDAVERVTLLSIENTDIPDPIGGGQEEYEQCGGEISRHLAAIVEELEPQSPRKDFNPES